MYNRRWLGLSVLLAAACLASCISPREAADDAGSEDSGLDGEGPAGMTDGGDEQDAEPAPVARNLSSTASGARAVRPTQTAAQHAKPVDAPQPVLPFALAGAPASGTIVSATTGGSGPSSHSVTLTFNGTIDNTPSASSNIGGVKVAYTRNTAARPGGLAAARWRAHRGGTTAR